MSWLSQNWNWVVILLFLGSIFLLTRFSVRAGAGGCGMGGCGAGDMKGHDASMGGDPGGNGGSPAAGPASTIDPVNRRASPADAAICSMYRDRAYYFETRANRELFENDPEKYLAGSAVAGQPIAAGGASPVTRALQHPGCC